MNSQTYSETQFSASQKLTEIMPEDFSRHMRRELAAETVRAEMAAMEAAGKVLQLTDEEIRMLRSFRRFKATIRKDGEVFKWQTRRVEGIVAAPETQLIHDPAEVA